MIVLTSDTLLFVVFTAIVWYEFFFSMSALEWLIVLRVLTLLGGLGVLLFLAVTDEEAADEEPTEKPTDEKAATKTAKNPVHGMTMCTDCSKAYHRLIVKVKAAAKDDPESPTRPLEESDEFADLLNSKQL